MPGRELAGPVEPGLQVVRGDWPEAAVVDVVLARPHHLDRSAGLLRQQHRIDDEIDVAVSAPAEAAAHQHVVELHLVARNAEQLGGRFAGGRLALRSRPDFDRIARRRHRSDGVERLHLRVIGVVAAILGIDRTWLPSASRRARRRSCSTPSRRGRGSSHRRRMLNALVAVEAPGGPGPAPGHGAAPGVPRTRPTACRRARRPRTAAGRSCTTPAIALALASSILSGTEPSTGARSTVP